MKKPLKTFGVLVLVIGIAATVLFIPYAKKPQYDCAGPEFPVCGSGYVQVGTLHVTLYEKLRGKPLSQEFFIPGGAKRYWEARSYLMLPSI